MDRSGKLVVFFILTLTNESSKSVNVFSKEGMYQSEAKEAYENLCKMNPGTALVAKWQPDAEYL